jgi:hypothetical protein
LLSKLQIASTILALTQDSSNLSQIVKDVWEYQWVNNAVLRQFVQNLGRKKEDGPVYLPVEAFKHHDLSSVPDTPLIFKSSGTTTTTRATHRIANPDWYKKASQQHFEACYGKLSDWVILALLPSYQSNGDSSLVFMVENFINQAKPGSCFISFDHELLKQHLHSLKDTGQQTMLFGVSYALLDFAEQHQIEFPELTIMETGGMKGRREELTRLELHEKLKQGFKGAAIHSEYGMTELLSQGYALDGEWFRPPAWLIPSCTHISDPLETLPAGRRGLLAFIDLANLDSCAFIQTKDIGIVRDDGCFKVEGRLDNSDLRGCNLLYTS